jgi:hypothetical protein
MDTAMRGHPRERKFICAIKAEVLVSHKVNEFYTNQPNFKEFRPTGVAPHAHECAVKRIAAYTSFTRLLAGRWQRLTDFDA